jgi:HPt (histidine-containing phosphotransfer) domain-containing protein
MDDPIADLEAARTRLGGDPELVRTMIGYVLADIPKSIDQLRTALTSRDFASLARHAHNVRGLVMNLGASGVGARAKHLEEAADAGQAESLSRLTDELIASVEKLSSFLRASYDH